MYLEYFNYLLTGGNILALCGLVSRASAVFVSLAIWGICVLFETLVLALPGGNLYASAKTKSRAAERHADRRFPAKIHCLKRDLCNRAYYKWIACAPLHRKRYSREPRSASCCQRYVRRTSKISRTVLEPHPNDGQNRTGEQAVGLQEEAERVHMHRRNGNLAREKQALQTRRIVRDTNGQRNPDTEWH